MLTRTSVIFVLSRKTSSNETEKDEKLRCWRKKAFHRKVSHKTPESYIPRKQLFIRFLRKIMFQKIKYFGFPQESVVL